MAFSSSLMMRLLRSGPATTRSSASLNSGVLMIFLLRRAARMAASLTRLARSAPEKPGDCLATRLEVDLLVERLALDVHLEDLEAALHVRPVEDDLAVEAAGAQQRRVEHVGPVGGGHDDDVGVGVEAVHLDQDLVERLLTLVVRAAQAGAALAAHGVDLVDEDDAGAVALGLVEEVAHAAGADAHEHLHELRAGDAEEGHAGLAGDGPGQQRLAGARRADEEHATRDARAQRVELLGVLEELDDLLQLRLGLVHAGHVGEGDDRLVAQEHARPALAEAHGLVVAALRLAEHEPQEDADEQDGEEHGDEQAEEGVAVLGRLAVGTGTASQSGPAAQACIDVVLQRRRELAGTKDSTTRLLPSVVLLLERDLELLATHEDGFDLALRDGGQEGIVGAAVGDGLRRLFVEEEEVEQRGRTHDEDEGDEPVAHEATVQGGTCLQPGAVREVRTGRRL